MKELEMTGIPVISSSLLGIITSPDMNSVILLHVSVSSLDIFRVFVSFSICLCEGLFRQLNPSNTFVTSL